MREGRQICESKPTRRIPIIRCKHSLDDCKFIEDIHNGEIPAIAQRGSAVSVTNAEKNRDPVDKEVVSTKN